MKTTGQGQQHVHKTDTRYVPRSPLQKLWLPIAANDNEARDERDGCEVVRITRPRTTGREPQAGQRSKRQPIA